MFIKLNYIIVWVLFFCFLWPKALVWAQFADQNTAPNVVASDPVLASVLVEPKVVRAGEYFRLVLELEIAEGWAINTLQADSRQFLPTSIVEGSSNFIAQTPWYSNQASIKELPALNLKLEVHTKKGFFYKNFLAPKDLLVADYALPLQVTYQACSLRICLLPTTKSLNVNIPIQQGPPRPEFSFVNKQVDSLPAQSIISELSSQQSWLSFMLLAAGLGLLSLLSPCVLPMLPLTISHFAYSAKHSNYSKSLLIIIFILSVVGVYTVWGLLISVIWGAGFLVKLASLPFVNLGLAALFIFFSLSLMGVLTVPWPSRLVASLDGFGARANILLRSLAMGITFTICAVACNLPLIGSLLVVAAAGEFFWPLTGMLSYSLAIAGPLCLFGLMPFRHKVLQGGLWQKLLQMFLATLMLIASTKFIISFDLVQGWQLLHRDLVLIIWMLIVMGGLLYTAGLMFLYRQQLTKHITTMVVSSVLGITYLLTIFFLSSGFNNYSLGAYVDALLPPPINGKRLQGRGYVESDAAALLWQDNFQQALLKASSKKQNILLYFSGYTCVNCRWVEQTIFSRQLAYDKLSQDLLLVRLYTDSGENYLANQQLQINRFGTVALPFFAIISSDNQLLAKHIGIFANEQEFINFVSFATEPKKQ